MEATIQKWGNSYAVRLAMTLANTASLKENGKVKIILCRDKIVIRKPKKAYRTWAERFEGYTEACEVEEFGLSAVGDERFWESE